MHRQNDNQMSPSERRRRKKQAEQRVQAWESLRNANQAQVPGQYPFNAPLTPKEHQPYHATRSQKNLIAVVARATVGASAAVALAGASPLVSGNWHWLGLGSCVLACVVALRVAAGAGDRRARGIGWSVAAAVILLTGVGAITQNVSGGTAVPAGTVKDRTIDELRAIEQAVSVLQENQKLLYLAPEQALGIQTAYVKARDQAVYVMERWNPVTADNGFDVDVLLLMTDLNAAAARQAVAFESFTSNLANPEPAVVAKMQTLRAETERLIDGEVVPKLQQLTKEYEGRDETRP